MLQKNLNEVFNLIVSTKHTLIGADTSKFKMTYAPFTDPTHITDITGDFSEVEVTIDNPRQVKTSIPTPAGSRIIHFDPDDKDDDGNPTTNIQAGDVIEYATGYYGYVLKVVNGKVYLKRPVKVDVGAGETLKQVGKTGDYETPSFSIGQVGDFIIKIEAPEYNIDVEKRVTIIDTSVHSDPDAPENSEAVAI